jgi:hypothetical protein
MIRPNNCHWFISEASEGTFEWAVLVQPQRVTWGVCVADRFIKVYCN